MNYAVHPCSSASRRQRDSVTEPLDKYASPAGCPDTSKPARLDIDLDNSTVGGQIDQASLVAAMYPARDGTAFGAGPHPCARSRRYDDLRGSDLDAINGKPTRCQLCFLRITAHLQ
jgi:hypothetical protein